jgi:hypothetical protein
MFENSNVIDVIIVERFKYNRLILPHFSNYSNNLEDSINSPFFCFY